jgi:hypothetical protein
MRNDKFTDRFTLERIGHRLQQFMLGGDDSGDNIPSKRGVTKSPFDAKYRKHRKMRMRMQKESRRINRR